MITLHLNPKCSCALIAQLSVQIKPPQTPFQAEKADPEEKIK
jgi:hypothetical protein